MGMYLSTRDEAMRSGGARSDQGRSDVRASVDPVTFQPFFVETNVLYRNASLERVTSSQIDGLPEECCL